ncbi:MAG: DUF1015 domain-containing protein, partial [Cyclobacteriaceae bacterium]|nr:DUF1015 domain-containing protein [Cyclobacteriaceae bacterium]
MAEIRPLRAWRYADSLYKKIDEITSPLFDVVSEKQRQKLYQNPYSSIHLSVPQDSAHSARQVLEKWKTDGTIIQDPLPGIYVYYQYFSLPGSVDEICRKGFMCNIRLTEWHEKVVLHHENTMSQAVEERTDVIKKTELNVSPTHGLYTDIDFELEKYMDDSMKNPVYETEDYQGVRDVLSIIHDYKIIQKFITKLKDKTIILADGHHRYQGSLDYMHLAKSNNPQHNGQEGYNFHLMYLTNTESDNLRILPTHRLVNNLANFNENEIIEKLGKYFTIKPIEDTFYLNEIICGKKYAFGLIFKSQAYKVRLKPEYYNGVTWPFPDVIKQLDLTVMHYFIIEKALGIPGPKQRNTK